MYSIIEGKSLQYYLDGKEEMSSLKVGNQSFCKGPKMSYYIDMSITRFIFIKNNLWTILVCIVYTISIVENNKQLFSILCEESLNIFRMNEFQFTPINQHVFANPFTENYISNTSI